MDRCQQFSETFHKASHGQAERRIMDAMDAQAQDSPLRSDWYERRGIVVADDLDQLRGPQSGKVALPVHLDGSAHPVYDLDRALLAGAALPHRVDGGGKPGGPDRVA